MKKADKIPRIPHSFFRWYCKTNRYEELHGDLEEYFYERLETRGVLHARWRYWLDVIRCCQPYAWKKPKGQLNSNIIMFKNYFKTSLRSMWRNPLSAFINIFGLAVAIGVCIVVYTMLEFSYSTDQFHEHKNEVFVVTFDADVDGRMKKHGYSPTALGPNMKHDLAQVKRMTRMHNRPVVVKNGDNVFHENVWFADRDYLDMLTFPLQSGDRNALADRNSIIISEEMAVKYFGYSDALGKELVLKFSEDRKRTFTVGGVAKAFPLARSFEFDFLLNFENLRLSDPDFDFNDWSSYIRSTLIQVEDANDIAQVRTSMEEYRVRQNASVKQQKIESFDFVSIAELHNEAGNLSNDISREREDELTVGLPVMGIFMLALACFNYINMAIGSATKRLKEIGVRKVIGANRAKVTIQFLAENLLVTFIALLLGLALTATVFLPWFSEIADSPLSLSLVNTELWVFLSIMLLATGLISGLYPSVYISRFRVINIFRGKVTFGKKNPLMKTFLGLQMVLAFVFITMAVMFRQNSDYQAARPWGYDQKGALYVNVPNHAAFDQLKGALEQNPDIEAMAGSANHIGLRATKVWAETTDRSYEAMGMFVDEDYFDVMGIRFKSGRAFQPDNGGARQVVVSELFAKNAQLREPVGQLIKLDTVQYQIVGVIHDFHAYNFFNDLNPMVFVPAAKEDLRYLSMRVRSGTEIEVLDDLKAQWATLYPEIPFQGGLQEDLWNWFYHSLDKMKQFTGTVAFIAILVAALGLYGLVNLNIAGRYREFSIRKALGARLLHMTGHVSRQYWIIMGLSLVLGAPLAYKLNLGLVEMMFADALPNPHWSVLVALFMLMLIMLTVIFTQVRRVVVANPVDGLRSE